MEHIGGTSSSRLRDASAPRLTSDRGFTLIETIVAALILTTALVALAQLLAVSVRMHKLGRDSAQATRLAQDKFEELMKLNFATAPALSTVTCANSLGGNTANCFDVPANTGFTRRWRVQAGPANNPALRTVTIRMVAAVRVGADFEVTQVLRSW
jgi:prepilin-type N-terminal cleavage/methylation domain-containing protein